MVERAKSLGDLSETMLQCRDEGHLWTFRTDEVAERGGRLLGYTQVRECGRCAALRRRSIDGDTFQIRRTTYTYPDGYLFEQGAGVRNTDVRREVIARVVGRRG